MWKSENVLLPETGSQLYGSLNFLLQSTFEMTLAYQKPINILQQIWIAYDYQNYIWHYSKETLVCLMLRTFHNGHPSPKVEKLYDSFSVQVFIFCHIIDAYCSFPMSFFYGLVLYTLLYTRLTDLYLLCWRARLKREHEWNSLVWKISFQNFKGFLFLTWQKRTDKKTSIEYT